MNSSGVVSPDKNFETLLARYGAPVLLGKKPAALFAGPLPRGMGAGLAGGLRPETASPEPGQGGLRFLNLARPGHNPLVFVFRPLLLERSLEDPQARRALAGFGYPVSEGLQALLRYLGRRFQESREFPHEIGFFLGYPPQDVLGFIWYRGAGCKLCGPWKVYGDVERAALLFGEYAWCKQRLLEHLREGGTVFDEELPALHQPPKCLISKCYRKAP
ncbi:MAG: DUF3793 family protein [Treponema sp.]|jgi:hypothetical protein|nr:DUF3793 family protein [Treponema sp.]